MELIKKPNVLTQDEKPYIGIRFSAPYSKMFHYVELNLKQLKGYLRINKVITDGPFFLRYNRINMSGEMDLEVGVLGNYCNIDNHDIIHDKLPSGLYASLVYKGLGLAATKYLLNWIDDNNHIIQKSSHSSGDLFACRYEAYLTDQKEEPRKKKWDIELSIMLIS
jgi:effector-binding domain-containing protein